MPLPIRLIVLLGAGYLALCIFAYLLQDRLVFLPRPVLAPPQGPHVVTVSVPRPDATLRGWIVNPESAGPLIVYFGGNAEELSTTVETFRRLEATTALLNYRGYGESSGSPSAARLIDDAHAVVHAVVERWGAERPLILFGRSLGSGIALQAALRADPDAMILMSPYPSLTRLAKRVAPFLPVTWLLRHRIEATEAVGALPGRILVLYGRDDLIIPAAESRALLQLLPASAEAVSFAEDHNVPLTHPDLWPHIRRFVSQY